MAELGVPSVSVPPLTVSVSSLCNWPAFCAPVLTVIVWLPGTLISTACPLVGTPRVQFEPSDQSPLVPIHWLSCSAAMIFSATLLALHKVLIEEPNGWFTMANVPLRQAGLAAQVMTWNWLPGDGVNPLTLAMFSVPLRIAVPLTSIQS